MATYSSILAWTIQWTEEPGAGYSPWGRKESDMTERLTLHLLVQILTCKIFVYLDLGFSLVTFNTLPNCRYKRFNSVQFSSVTQSCLTLCDPMNCSMPGLPVHHQLPEFTQTHVHRGGDAIQPSHPLSSPSPPAPSPSQHQSLFQ